MAHENTFVISLGGALVIPNERIDTQFLSAFNAFIRKQVSEKNRRFFITVGGGAVMRQYRDVAKEVHGNITEADLDWLGIHATRLNAQLVRAIFKDIANPRLIKHYEIILKTTQSVTIASGWKPGWSIDYCAVTLCQDYGIKHIINMTTSDMVYTKDSKTGTDAKPTDTMTWKNYCALAGDTWTPGLTLPFDPIAARLAGEMDLTVKILNGKDLDNLERALDNKSFVGTTIVN
ncbi:MAG: UMP kinase [Microgenomates group bacterium]